jgi:MFS family permease
MVQPATSSGSRETQGRSAVRPDRRWLILVVVAVAQLMVVLDATIVNIALPSAQHSLGFANSDRQWVVTAYALAFGSLLLVGGRLGDMYSPGIHDLGLASRARRDSRSPYAAVTPPAQGATQRGPRPHRRSAAGGNRHRTARAAAAKVIPGI